MVTILFGRKIGHYKQHWLALFTSYEVESWQEFQGAFLGNTCDFSDAGGESTSFVEALMQYAMKQFGVSLTKEECYLFYKYCNVHFERS
jgi:hypothetical protein